MTIGFVVTQTATGQDATVSVSADQRLAFGEELKVRGQVSGAEQGEQVKLLYAPRGQDYKTVDTARTGERGGYVLRHRPMRTGTRARSNERSDGQPHAHRARSARASSPRSASTCTSATA